MRAIRAACWVLLLFTGMAWADPKVVFIPKGATHVFWREMARGAQDAASKMSVSMVWRGPSLENDVDAQLGIMNFYVGAHFNGIILAPDSATGLSKPISAAQAAGLSMVIVDSPLAEQNGLPYVGTNNHQAGMLAAAQAAQDMPTAKKILLLRYAAGHGSTSERERGFAEAIRRLLPHAELLDGSFAGVTVQTAQDTVGDMLRQHPDIDLIFTPNESSTEGAILGLRDARLAGKTRLYGFDFNKRIFQALQDGTAAGVVIQDPYAMGQKAMLLMADQLAGKTVPARFETPAIMLTRRNLAAPEVKAKIEPFLTRYQR
ncbi:ribose transport system substrate-binding protein [Andreprevotia lacus DSM 23236]|jgi:ribose transport system substrate-binding protein|uniref:Ribose transport system substrate-binding protein n=1 Tax=Andreprevotia lacus DSM 23236 TaxID=1121001 RepID=A0A1W1XPK0_9NEIS|nr:substrate-binding domain-containing protein [Andreprevotia lacus]SMC25893.1 ribose transport system substrate-binding protein [Andreprevotia lacus DSM 23236]